MSRTKKSERRAPEETRRFAGWLRRTLKARDMTQVELAEEAGLAHTTLNYILCGQTDPRFSTVCRILAALGLRIGFAAIAREPGSRGEPEREEADG